MRRAVALPALLLAVAALGAAGDGFRFSRTVEAPAGEWCVLELPDDVLDACRPGLPDVRLREGGVDVPFAVTREEGGAPRRYELSNVESIDKKETTAILDRGVSPPLARSVELEVVETEFLKPVVLEASPDGRDYREIARGSLFAAGGVRSTTLRFPANDRRFWRFRFDDRNGPPVRAASARIEPAGAALPPREVGVSVYGMDAGPPQILSARLPAANLGVSVLRLRISDAAFERRVRVFERVFFRDEVSRRLVGAGTIERAPDGVPDADVAVCDLTRRDLEIEIEGSADSRPLTIDRVTALASPAKILFFAGAGVPRVLLYGSASAPASRYDLARVLRDSIPRRPSRGSLGSANQIAAAPLPPPPARGAAVDGALWKTRRTLQPPAAGGVAYVDLSGEDAAGIAALRIVDAENRPVPYLVETTIRRRAMPAALRPRQEGSRTILETAAPAKTSAPDAITLTASGPEYFARDAVLVVEDERDARGVTGARVLGSARWERRPGDPPAALTIPIAPPRAPQVRIEIENGDNPPVAVSAATWQVPYVRLDYVCAPAEKLWLLSGNDGAPPPRYDLAMVADRVLSSAAAPSSLGPPEVPRVRESRSSRWLWSAIVGAALVVVLVLSRTLKSALPGD